STGPSEVIVTRAVASRAQLGPPFMAAVERSMSNLIFGFGSARAGADPPRHNAIKVTSPVTAQSLREGIGECFPGCGRQLMEVETSPRLFVVLSFMCMMISILGLLAWDGLKVSPGSSRAGPRFGEERMPKHKRENFEMRVIYA